jgi:uncharacterized membrane protein YraQ (UPF0718 family)
MTLATSVLWGLALLMMLIAWRRKDGSLRRGFKVGWQTLRRTLPLLLVAFAITGYVDLLAPQGLVREWIGPASGWRGLLVGGAAGMLLPGGPYVVFPLIATLYQGGAGLGPTLAMVTSWATLALLSVSYELPFLGWRFSMVRICLSAVFPILVGLAGMILFGG